MKHLRIRLLLYMLLLGLAVWLSPPAATAQEPPPSHAKIDPRVLEEITINGQTTFWVTLAEEADLQAAIYIQDWAARGQFVYDQLRATAAESQADLRSLLDKEGVPYQPFWIVNTIQVTGDRALVYQLAAEPVVTEILADQVLQLPEPQPGLEQARTSAIEWNIERINAPSVWADYGTRGEGIVVANIDTGVEFDHPALFAQYRGNLGNGVLNHNYNWFDPSNVCGEPSLAPCDNNDHGTHTMGTIVGDDGSLGDNQIGVAPGARWIAAKGCESGSCSRSALLASGQWMLAPTDLNGENPRPDLRPHVVNNSWGAGSGQTQYQEFVDAWVASGIFPAFSNGNSGRFGCETSGSPGDYLNSYSTGAFDIDNAIADFSSRGPSAFGGGAVKPNIAAPGVDVRSSVRGGGYAANSGTSMASPHVAGAVALMWSAAPTLIGDIAGTRALLDQTAIDTADDSCGGTAGNNNVYGEGRLDVLLAVEQSPRGSMGVLQGTVVDAAGGAPINGVAVNVSGPVDRATLTNASGAYSLTLPIGDYEMNASASSYVEQTVNGVEINQGATTEVGFSLVERPHYAVSGTVRDNFGQPIDGAKVTLLSTPIQVANTNAEGHYVFARVPEGTHEMRAEVAGCTVAQTRVLTVNAEYALDFTVAQRSDNFGYSCDTVPASYIEANRVLQLTGDDSSLEVTLPFPFTFYGRTYTTAHICTNGYINFLNDTCEFQNQSTPNAAAPNGAIYAYWDDLVVDNAASVRSATVGRAPERRFVIEWRNVRYYGESTRRIDVQVILYERDGSILTQYRNIANDNRERGSSATLGIENRNGTDGLQLSYNEAVIDNTTFAALYQLAPMAVISDVQVTNVTDTSLTISWYTDQQVDAKIYYGTDPDNLSQVAVDVRGAGFTDDAHYVVLTDLAPDTTYYFNVASGRTRDNNGGSHYTVTTGPTLAIPSVDTVFGQVVQSDGTTPVTGAIVYISLLDADGDGSRYQAAPLSALTDGTGFWSINLAQARRVNLADRFVYAAGGDKLFLDVEAVLDGQGCQLVDTAADAPAATVVLNTDLCPAASEIPVGLSWNVFSLPVAPLAPYTAATVCEAINGQGGMVTEINRWENGWEGHVCGLPFSDFPLELGAAYFIRSSAVSTWTIQGFAVSPPLPLEMQVGWNAVGVPHDDTYTAERLCRALADQGVTATEIDRWQAGGWNAHVCGLPFNDFPLTTGNGYLVQVNSAGGVVLGASDAGGATKPGDDKDADSQSLRSAILQEAVAQQGVQVSNVRITNVSDTSVTISWFTDGDALGLVRFGQGDLVQVAYDERGAGVRDRVHKVVLTELTPNTTYSFEIIPGGTAADAALAFTTGPTPTTIAPPDTVYGRVVQADGTTPVADVQVFLSLHDADGQGNSGASRPLLALTDEDGYWHFNLGNARGSDSGEAYAYAAADSVLFTLQTAETLIEHTVSVEELRRGESLLRLQQEHRLHLPFVTR